MAQRNSGRQQPSGAPNLWTNVCVENWAVLPLSNASTVNTDYDPGSVVSTAQSKNWGLHPCPILSETDRGTGAGRVPNLAAEPGPGRQRSLGLPVGVRRYGDAGCCCCRYEVYGANGTLVINDVDAADEGVYRCVGLSRHLRADHVASSRSQQVFATRLHLACEYSATARAHRRNGTRATCSLQPWR